MRNFLLGVASGILLTRIVEFLLDLSSRVAAIERFLSAVVAHQ